MFSKVKAIRKGREREMFHLLQWKELIFFLFLNLYLPLCNSLSIHGPEANISVVAFHSLIPINSYRKYSFLILWLR